MMFCKVFDTSVGQMLLTKDFDDEQEDGAFRLVARGEDYRGVQATMSFGWPTEAERDAAFETADQERAENTATDLRRMIEGLMGKEDPA